LDFNLVMGRSPGFGSTHTYYSPISDSLSLRLHIRCLTLHVCVTRRFIIQKARHHPLRALTTCKHTVSGSISLPFRGAFHLSLTVLVHYGHQGVFSLRRWSSQIPTEFLVFRRTQDTSSALQFVVYGTVT